MIDERAARQVASPESFVCAADGSVVARAPHGEDHVLFAVDLAACRASHARRLFFRDRRPDLYPQWLAQGE